MLFAILVPDPHQISELRTATEKGKLEGMQKGRQQGEIKGKLEGEAALLESFINKRFGPLNDATRARMSTATLEQLELWADRILDAGNLEEVFQDN